MCECVRARAWMCVCARAHARVQQEVGLNLCNLWVFGAMMAIGTGHDALVEGDLLALGLEGKRWVQALSEQDDVRGGRGLTIGLIQRGTRA